jgi:aminoglycoside phosphotransferase (APT) family kinase protein
MVAEIRGLIQRLGGPIPEIAGAAEPLLAWLFDLDARHPAQPAVPAHGTFRPAQVLLHQGDIGFIDFDSFCQAEPALDVALFRAAIKDIGAGSESPAGTAGSPLETLADGFLRHYEAVAPISRERVMLWETGHLLVYVLHAWTKVSAKRLPARMATLRRHLLSSGLPAAPAEASARPGVRGGRRPAGGGPA